MRLGDLLHKLAEDKKPLTLAEKDELRLKGNLADGASGIATKVEPLSGNVKRLVAGSTTLGPNGVTVRNGATDTIRLETDGDAFFGSNLSAPATTSLIIFSNDQTYNSESVGAADVLLGDNSTNKANILWDKSAGKLLFRGGTTEQGSIDVDGSATFGGGDIILNSTGIHLQPAAYDVFGQTTSISWEDTLVTPNHILGSINSVGEQFTNPGDWALLDIWAGAADYDSTTYYNYSTIDLQALTKGATENYNTFLEVYAEADATEALVFYMNTIKGAANARVFSFIHKFSDRTTRFGIGVSAPTAALQVSTDHYFPADGNGTIVINEQSRDMDFRVESNGDANALFVDGGTDRVGILNGSPSTALDVTGTITGTTIVGANVTSGEDPGHTHTTLSGGATGWVSAGETWTYASASTFTVGGNRTLKYHTGTKLGMVNSGIKYFYVVSSSYSDPNTTVVVTGGTDYTIANAAISVPTFSYQDSPQGFPMYFNYTPTGISASNVTLTGRFSIAAGRCFVDFLAAFTGAITFTTYPTLPVTASASYKTSSELLYATAGVAAYLDSGTAYVLGTLTPTVIASATTFGVIRSSDGTSMSATIPITWANNDKLTAHFSYEL